MNVDGVLQPAPAGGRSFESFPVDRKPLSSFFPFMEVSNTHLMKSSVRISRGVESLFGTRDENIRLIEAGLGVQTQLLDNNLEIEGEAEDVSRAANILEDYNALLREGHVFTNGDLNSYLRVVTNDREVSLRALVNSGKQRNFGKKVLAPKTVNQRRYLEAIERNDLVIGIGPAGTGKTYLAVAMAISALMNKQVARIVLTRPAVEAGERLGFLPGTLQEKVDPYLRPLYDALYDMLDSERVEKLLERNVIEVAPIAFMRGRTLNDSFIILDEAQNCTPEQMKMVLTRQGFNSKMVVNGDVTQIDLPSGRRSGLIDATEVLKGVEGISFVQFDDKDVVRHTLVQRIVKAYERYNEAIGAGRQLTLPLAAPAENGNGNGEVKVEIPLTETAPLA
jgi:phosphate starvation-inducible PhoH-like protein